MGTGVAPKRIATESFRVLKFCGTSEKIREKLVFLSYLFLMYQRDSRDRETLFRGAQNVLLLMNTHN